MLYLISFILFLPHALDSDSLDQIITWNVGQGQWITAIEQKSCTHFDVGGEFFSAKKISEACLKKKNYIYLSHWDWDHIGLIHKLKNTVKDICIATPPLGNTKSYKKEFLNKISRCDHKVKSSQVTKLNFKYPMTKEANDLSQIFIYKKQILIPGDSTKKIEKLWSPQLKNKKFKLLSVSHHGSKTSTSEFFLKNMSFDQAIVSARKDVYGHPHKSVLKRLKKYKIPLLKTEDWGNIRVIF